MTPEKPSPIRIAVSSCLMGQCVRYDGSHRRNAGIINLQLADVELLPICPEVAIGLGVPRPPVQLVDKDGDIRVLGLEDPTLDVTDKLTTYALEVAEQAGISGYIFKSRSPSCGLKDVKVYASTGEVIQPGRGLFADTLLRALPLLPVIEDEELQDPAARSRFLEQVRCYAE